MSGYVSNAFTQAQKTLDDFIQSDAFRSIEPAVQTFVTSLKSGGRILACGNGGSMCDSLHFAEELTGRYRKDRRPLSAMSMGEAGHMTCVGNDFGFDKIFSRNVEAWGRPGDSLLAISTSGNSKNIIEAVQVAKQNQIKTVGLLGKSGGELKSLVDIPIVVPCEITDRIQEIHIKIIHCFIEGIERDLFPDHYSQD